MPERVKRANFPALRQITGGQAKRTSHGRAVFLRLKLFSMDNGDNKGLSTGGVAAPR
jgi:hypothetical protein